MLIIELCVCLTANYRTRDSSDSSQSLAIGFQSVVKPHSYKKRWKSISDNRKKTIMSQLACQRGERALMLLSSSINSLLNAALEQWKLGH